MLEVIQGLNSGAALTLAILVLLNPLGYNKKGNFILGLFLLFLFFQLFDEIFDSNGVYIKFPYLSFLPNLFFLLMPTLLYLGILYYIYPNRKMQVSDLKYFLLPLGFVFLLVCIIIGTQELEILSRDSELEYVENIYSLLLLACLLATAIFWIKGYKLLKEHKRNTENYSAARKDVNLNWFVQFHYVYLVMIAALVLSIFYASSEMITIANVVFLLGIFLIAYHAVKQGSVYADDTFEEKEILAFIAENKIDQQEVAIATDEEKQLQEKLLHFLLEEKPYLDNKMNLAKLSKAVDMNTHQLSAVINNAIGKNFSNFINDYRIEEAKAILGDSKKKHYTMLQVAFEAGFNSKTVFNTYFKKSTGKSPSEYKKHQLGSIFA